MYIAHIAITWLSIMRQWEESQGQEHSTIISKGRGLFLSCFFLIEKRPFTECAWQRAIYIV